MGTFVDLTGKIFGKLTVIRRDEDYVSPKGYIAINWLCKCECGQFTVVRGCNLKSGATKSCGCERIIHPNRISHGEAHTRLHNIWKGMKRRCTNANEKSYYLYGGRGISVCEEWLSYEAFRDWAIENGYNDSLSIDRINVNGDYEPNNCRWVDIKIQANNKRSNHILEYNNQSHTMAEWARITGISYAKIKGRINKCGWDVESALTTP